MIELLVQISSIESVGGFNDIYPIDNVVNNIDQIGDFQDRVAWGKIKTALKLSRVLMNSTTQ